MAHDTVIGIIGGHGWMGRALGQAWLKQGLVPAHGLIVSSRTGGETYRDWPEVRCVATNQELAAKADVIVLSVRPEALGDIDISVPGKLVVSLLAMASLDEVAHQVGSQRVVRAMPNAAVEVQRAYFPWFAGQEITDADRRLISVLLESCGKAREMPTERDLEYMTALSGSGPAYPALLAQGMYTHALEMGITEDIAREAVMETLLGGCLMLEGMEDLPGEMVKKLLAYNGTTAQGLKTMMDGGFDALVHQGLSASLTAAKKPL